MKKFIKELMIPVEEFPSVSEDNTLYEAVEALEGARGIISGYEYKPRGLLVVDGKGAVTGHLTLWDCLHGLEPKFAAVKLDLLGAHGVDADRIREIAVQHNLWTDPLDTLCAKGASMKVKKFMTPVKDEPSIQSDRQIFEAINRLVVEHRMTLLVTEKDKVVGFVRVCDLFQYLSDCMKKCAI